MTGTVIRLPTAASSRPKQGGFATIRAYRAANPWPGEYIAPWIRERDAERLELVGGADRVSIRPGDLSVPTVIALALFGMADKSHQESVLAVARVVAAARPCDATTEALRLMEHIVKVNQSPRSPERRLDRAGGIHID